MTKHEWTLPALPRDFPQGLTVHVQHATEFPGYVAMVHYSQPGMRFAVLHTQAYGDTPLQAWQRAVEQVKTNKLSLL
jgi:hypothetical protein